MQSVSDISWFGNSCVLPQHQGLGIFLHAPWTQEVFVKLPKAWFGCSALRLAAVSPRH